MNTHFLNCFALGLLGIALHIAKRIETPNNGEPNTFTTYLRLRAAEIVYSVLSYIIIMVLWGSGDIFQLPAFVGLEPIEPAPVSYWSILVGYCASSIMNFLTHVATSVLEIIKHRFGVKTDETKE